jgi:hypothetical protein
LPFVGANKEATGHEAVFGYIFGYSTSGYSGGISQYQLEESGKFLTLPVTDFYTNDLYLFCSDLLVSDDVKLMKLIFGIEKWKLPILMKIRELMWLDPEEENDDFQDQISELQIEAGVTDLTCIDNLISTLMQ